MSVLQSWLCKLDRPWHRTGSTLLVHVLVSATAVLVHEDEWDGYGIHEEQVCRREDPVEIYYGQW